MIEKHYINLTNGIEWIPRLQVPYSFCRITSTDIEKGNWVAVLRDLDADLLLNLALGHTCHVYDCGTRRVMSKTITKGLPYILSSLHNIWNGFDIVADTADKREMKRKLRYFNRYYRNTPIQMVGHCFATDNDGDREYYTDLLNQAGVTL